MPKTQSICMKCRMGKNLKDAVETGALGFGLRPISNGLSPILRIPNNWVIPMLGVDADLMCAARLQPKVYDGGIYKSLDRLIVRNRPFPVRLRHHGHPLSMIRISPNCPPNPSIRWIKVSPNDRPVLSINRVCLELIGQGCMSTVSFCNHQYAGGTFV